MSTDRANGPGAKHAAVSLPSPAAPSAAALASRRPAHLSSRTAEILIALVESAGAAPGTETLERARQQAHAIVEARKALIAELEQRCRVAAAAADGSREPDVSGSYAQEERSMLRPPWLIASEATACPLLLAAPNNALMPAWRFALAPLTGVSLQLRPSMRLAQDSIVDSALI